MFTDIYILLKKLKNFFLQTPKFSVKTLIRAQLKMTPNNKSNNYTKTPYTQYFCLEKEGMKLRSGTAINCIKKTPLYDDLRDLYENMTLPLLTREDGVYEFATWHSHKCYSIINQLRFIESHHETLPM